MSEEFTNGYKRLSPILRACRNGNGVEFWCPACDDHHLVLIAGTGGPIWWWNGDVNAPTFRDSVLVEGLQTCKDAEGRWAGGWVMKDGKGIDTRCHSYVTDGKIEYLGDCSHEMAGQTVALEVWYTHETEGLPGRPRRN